MNLSRTIKNLCAPARFYLGVSVFMILLLIVQNLLHNNSNQLCVGSFTCNVSVFSNVAVIFIIKILYIVLWTWLLNVLCRYGFKPVSWFLVLLPFVLFAVGIALLMYSDPTESFSHYPSSVIQKQNDQDKKKEKDKKKKE